jgi:hypothetical protein
MITLEAVLAGVLAVLTLAQVRRVIAVTIVAALVLGVAAPVPVQGQIGLVGFWAAVNAVLKTINSFISGLLDTANSVLSQINVLIQAFQNLMDNVVYPRNLIARAQGLVASMIGQFRGLLSSIFNIGVNSAQLPNPIALEGIVRNRSASDFAQLTQAYGRTFGTVPAETDAHPIDRQLIDMDDAMAQAQLKTLKTADAIADQTIAASTEMENEAQRVAPGTAAFLSAAGTIAAIQNQAVMQKMIAGQMRQEAARVAHDNMLRKRNAMLGRELRQGVSNLYRR